VAQSKRNTPARVIGNAALAIEHALTFDQQESQLKKMLHADKLATVGQLAAGAAHEIRNPPRRRFPDE